MTPMISNHPYALILLLTYLSLLFNVSTTTSISPIESPATFHSFPDLPLHQQTTPTSSTPATSLIQLPLSGTWQLKHRASPSLFSTTEKREGAIYLDFNNGFFLKNGLLYFDRPLAPEPLSSLQMIFIDGKYFDQDLYFVNFSNITAEVLSAQNSTLIIQRSNSQFGPLSSCSYTINIDLAKAMQPQVMNNTTYDNILNGLISLDIVSPDCSINVRGTLQTFSDEYGAHGYYETLFEGCILIATFLTNTRLLREFLNHSVESSRISILIPVCLAIWDLVFLVNMHVFSYLETSILSLVIFCLECALFMLTAIPLLSVPMLRTTKYLPEDVSVSDLALLILGYGVPTMLFTILIVIFSERAFFQVAFLLLINLYLLPQIVHNAFRGAPVPFEPKIIFNIVSLRPLSPLYLKACPYNLYNISPSVVASIAIVSIIALQIIVLYFQAKSGVRFFLPRDIFERRHSYFRHASSSIASEKPTEGVELIRVNTGSCKLCMGNLSFDEDKENSRKSSLDGTPSLRSEVEAAVRRMKAKPGKKVRTECGHKFHAGCLVEWMMVRMECPICGKELKPLE